MSEYRVGRHLGRTIYRDGELIGTMDTPELGALVVEALNARERVLTAPGRNDLEALGTQGKHDSEGTQPLVPPHRDMTIPQSCQDENGEACSPRDCMLNGSHYVTQDEVHS